MKYANTIDDAVKTISDFQQDNVITHFIYCGLLTNLLTEIVPPGVDFGRFSRHDLEEIFRSKMKTYGIKSAILTMLNMWRNELVTKETVKQAYEGKLKNDVLWRTYEGSINDDLETFFTDLQNQKEIKNEKVLSFFMPKLSDKELKLVQEKNKQHLRTYSKFCNGRNPDVKAEEMKKSDSKSKYVHGTCVRRTIRLTLESDGKRAPDENAFGRKMPKK